MKKLTYFLISLLAIFVYEANAAKTIDLLSPNGKIKVSVTLSDAGDLSYLVSNNNTEVISESSLGINTSVGNFTGGLSYVSESTKEINETYSLPTGKAKSSLNHCNELELKLQRDSKEVLVIFRAYNEGVAYRYRIDGSGNISVSGETSEINIAAFDKSWGQKYVTDYSTKYPERTWAETAEVQNFCAPVLTRHNGSDNNWCLITEAANFGNYCTSVVKAGAASETGRFYFEKVGSISTKLPLETPWRVAMIGSLPTLVQSTMIEDLNPATDMKDISWIEPGISSWDWGGQDGSQSTSLDVAKGYIDLAYRMGWKYFTLDEGWERATYILKDVVDYADEKGVKVIIWSHQNRFINNEDQIRGILEYWKKLGFAGVKVDFWEDDSQAMTQKYDKLIDIAGELELLVNLHGCTKPSGTRRYWPHLITSEAAYCGEQYYFNHLATEAYHNVTLALTRNVIGSIDYTPIEFARLDGVIRHTTTWSHQVALGVIYESGLLTMSDSPGNYLNSVAKSLLKNLPTVWDEIKCLEANVDHYLTIARRDNDDWYIASISQEPRTMNIPLDFLGEGTYYAQIYKDGISRNHIDYEKKEVTKNSSLSIDFASQGGVTVRLSKTLIDEPQFTLYEAQLGDVQGEANITSDNDKLCTDGKYVGNLGNSGKGRLVMTVDATKAGAYDMCLYYISQDSRDTYIKINDGNKKVYNFSGNGFSWHGSGLAFKVIPVELQAGSNTIEFGNDSGWGINIDHITISPAEEHQKLSINALNNMKDKNSYTSTEAITFSIRNENRTPVENLKVSYSINGGAWVEETIDLSGSLTTSATFTQKADMSEEKAYYISIKIDSDASKNIVGDMTTYCVVHYPEANSDQLLSTRDGVKIHSYSSQVSTNEGAKNLISGDYNKKWSDNQTAHPWVIVDLGKEEKIGRFVFRDCRTKETFLNVDEYSIQLSTEAPAKNQWTQVVDTVGRRAENVKIDYIEPQVARYVKLTLKRPVGDGAIRIYGFDIYGNGTTGINEVKTTNEMTVYPNPVKRGDSITTSSEGTLAVFTLDGSKVMEVENEGKPIKIDLESGSYIIKNQNASTSSNTIKLIVR